MAEIKETYTAKTYSEEAKAKLHALLEAQETKEAMKVLDELDKTMATTAAPTTDMIKEYARKAIGWGNYLRKKHAKLSAAATNEKGNRYMEIKMECLENKVTFADGAAKSEAEAFIAPLRTVRDIFGAYVISADSIISVCRMHIQKQQDEREHEVDVHG